MSKYDVLLVMDNVKLSSKLIKKKSFPFPVPSKCSTLQFKAQVEQALKSTSFLLSGGQNFEIKVAQTESMPIKEAVKNVMHLVIQLTSLILYCGKAKHNYASEIFLATS